ncbi:hypothetical protein PVAP13_6KG017528 [Panicum virgatum]|uniref:KIB1-4 beta-propeller domain-containing protein n=1 Tax=Panicum virgatum TaxID=38727 RepID=A0A8T0R7A7_PANVG|nr:hypothetical protein PVAP13_6KG017528 [Panicum virgatum]
MRSNPEDLIAVATSNRHYNVILCRPGKGAHVLPLLRVIDVAFLGDDMLYGITSGDELVAFHLGKGVDGRPQVTRFRLVIVNPMAGYYNKHSWSWPADDTTASDYCYEYDGLEKDGNDDESNDEDDEAPYQEKNGNEEEEEADDEAEAANPEDDEEEEEEVDTSFNADDDVSDYEVREGDWELPYEAKDETFTARYLVPSLSGELLLVRHQYELTLDSGSYTNKVEVFKADVMAGRWIPVTAHDDGLGKDEALFLSRSFSKSTRAHGDVEPGLVHYVSGHMDDVLDTRSWSIRKMTFRWPRQRDLADDKWQTWLFPPESAICF